MISIICALPSIDERVVKVCERVGEFLKAVKVFPVVNPDTGKFLLDGLMTWVLAIRPSRKKRTKSQEYELVLVRINAYTGHVTSVIPLPSRHFNSFMQVLKQAREELLKMQPPKKVEELKKELEKLSPEEREVLLKELMKEQRVD